MEGKAAVADGVLMAAFETLSCIAEQQRTRRQRRSSVGCAVLKS
jgi:hypothetical protein